LDKLLFGFFESAVALSSTLFESSLLLSSTASVDFFVESFLVFLTFVSFSLTSASCTAVFSTLLTTILSAILFTVTFSGAFSLSSTFVISPFFFENTGVSFFGFCGRLSLTDC
jgi:hypothetical protein